jgi:hypothetical protein
MDIIEILLSNYEVPEFASNGYEVAQLSAVSADSSIVADPYYILVDSFNNAFYVSGDSLYVNDYSKLTTVLSAIANITLTVSGSSYFENVALSIGDRACVTSATSASTSGCCTTSGGIPNCAEEVQNYFNPLSSCYTGEDQLYQSLLEEAYNSAPIPATFYVISYDTSHDPINGEDPTRKIIRKFDFNGYNEELPKDEVMYSTGFGGIAGLDKFPLYVSKSHFIKQSQKDYLGNTVYPPYTPRGGEYILLKFNNKYYEVTRVKDTDEMNLQRKNSWTFLLKVFENDRPDYIAATSATMVNDIISVTEKEDIFNVSDIVDTEMEEIRYEPGPTEEAPNDPFVGWD